TAIRILRLVNGDDEAPADSGTIRRNTYLISDPSSITTASTKNASRRLTRSDASQYSATMPVCDGLVLRLAPISAPTASRVLVSQSVRAASGKRHSGCQSP